MKTITSHLNYMFANIFNMCMNKVLMNMTLNIKPLVIMLCMIQFSCGSSTSTDTSSDQVLKVSEDEASISSDGMGAKFDSSTELQTGFSVFAVKDIYIINGNDEKISGSEIALNTKFSIVYEGVKNYTLKDGKAFPSLSLQVSDDNGNIVMSETDLFASYVDGVSEADASVLRATITVGSPMKPGNYICSIQVTDKNNSEAGITSTWPFEVK